MTNKKSPAKKSPANKAAQQSAARKSSAGSKKAAYTRKSEARLEEAKAKLDVVKARIKGAVADGQIGALDTLDNAQKQADSHVAKVEKQIQRLKKTGEDSWEELKDGLENTWDDLMLSIKKIGKRKS